MEESWKTAMAIKIEGDIADAYVNLGNAWFHKGGLDMAIHFYNIALDYDNGLEPALNNLQICEGLAC